jgi:AraC family transcriptional regulator
MRLPDHYQKHVHRAVNYMAHNLDRKLDLDELAAVGGFSRFYFHHLFRAIMGEPVFHCLRRMRIERAAGLLMNQRDMTVLDVAHECGFDSPTSFARAFHAHFGRSAREWRSGGFWWYNGRRWEWRARDIRHERPGRSEEVDLARGLIRAGFTELADARRGKRFECLRDVRVASLPGFRIAYIRSLSPYDIGPVLAMWQRFARLVDGFRLMAPDSIGISLPRDNQHITAPVHFRLDVGMVVDSSFMPFDVLDVQEIPAGLYAVADFCGRLGEEPLANEYLWQYWMPKNFYNLNYGWVFRKFSLHDWLDRPLTPDSVFRYQICVPIKPRGAPLSKPEIVIEPMREAGFSARHGLPGSFSQGK